MNVIMRTFVAALALTGSAAYAHIVTNPGGSVVVVAHPQMPVPTCPPSDPNGCGICTK